MEILSEADLQTNRAVEIYFNKYSDMIDRHNTINDNNYGIFCYI